VPGPLQLDAWLVYFDGERGLAELREHGSLFDRVSLFAYELDPGGSPRPAPSMRQMVPRFLMLSRQKDFEPWVTVVNDVRYGVDSAIAKDPDLVHELIADSDRRSAHAEDLAERVAADGFAGLHLDYERVPEADSSEFQAFVGALASALEVRGLGLEVVLEPSRGPPPERSSANVTVMAYDLFGEHSGPGPRSTPEFVTELGPRARIDMDSAAAVALAVRGFSWDTAGNVTSLDWTRGHQLAGEARTRNRDNSNRVPSAQLDDGTQVFFEDAESLLGKWEAAWDVGFRRLAIWRLGGNDEKLYDLVRDIKSGG
jgi:spore germination protein YaaH